MNWPNQDLNTEVIFLTDLKNDFFDPPLRPFFKHVKIFQSAVNHDRCHSITGF